VGGKMVAMGQEVRIWEETTSCWALSSSPGRSTYLYCLQQQPWARHVHIERSLKPGWSLWPKVNRDHTTGACWAPRQFTKKKVLFHYMLDFQRRANMGRKGEHYTERSLNTWAAN
jgi:hypothetical protein